MLPLSHTQPCNPPHEHTLGPLSMPQLLPAIVEVAEAFGEMTEIISDLTDIVQ